MGEVRWERWGGRSSGGVGGGMLGGGKKGRWEVRWEVGNSCLVVPFSAMQ